MSYKMLTFRKWKTTFYVVLVYRVESNRTVLASMSHLGFERFVNFSNWELFIRCGVSQALHTRIGPLTVIIVMSVFIMGIKFDFGLVFYTPIQIWHRGVPFNESACSTHFLRQIFCVPGPQFPNLKCKSRAFQVICARNAPIAPGGCQKARNAQAASTGKQWTQGTNNYGRSAIIRLGNYTSH